VQSALSSQACSAPWQSAAFAMHVETTPAPCWNVVQHFWVVPLQVAVPQVNAFGVPPLDVEPPPSVVVLPSVATPPSVAPPELEVDPPLDVEPPPDVDDPPPEAEDVDEVLLLDPSGVASSVAPPHATIAAESPEPTVTIAET
jgi:hypothetical protein